MAQIGVLLVSIGLVVLGIKGFTASGIPFSKKTTLRGTAGKVVGTLCILAGVAFIPVFLLAFWGYGRLFGQ